MTDNVELNISPAIIEHFRCSVCANYLTSSPIRLLPDGNNICSRCSPPKDVLTYRQLTLENLLSDAIFPCKYKQNGCTVRLSFGCAFDHENKCTFRVSVPLDKQPVKPQNIKPQDGEAKVFNKKEHADAVNLNEISASDVPINSDAGSEVDASASYFTRHSNAPTPAPTAGSSRNGNLDWNANRRASISSNRSFRWNRNFQSPHVRAYDMRWEQHGSRNGWNRNRFNFQQFQNTPYGRRNMYYHKRSHRNSVVIIKGGTFYINF